MSRAKVLKLPPDDAKRAPAKALRAKLFLKCRDNAAHAGDDVAGFALVVWDRNDNLLSSYDAQIGPVGPALVPTLPHDSLNRHLAVMLAAEKVAAESGE